jgi:hypothetical protein
MGALPKNARQIPDQGILDYYNRQTYLENAYTYSAISQSAATTAETNVLLISNPATNVKPAGSFQYGNIGLFLRTKKVFCQTASQSIILNFYANPTVATAGTAKTPINLRTASAFTSIMNITTTPTTSANGTLMASLFAGNQLPDTSDILSILDPGQSILVTAIQSSSGTNFGYEFSWFEL